LKLSSRQIRFEHLASTLPSTVGTLEMSVHADALAGADLSGQEDVVAFGQWGMPPTSVKSPVKPPGRPHKSRRRSSSETTSDSLEDVSTAASTSPTDSPSLPGSQLSTARSSRECSRRTSLSSRRSSLVSCHQEIRRRASSCRRHSDLYHSNTTPLPAEVDCPTFSSNGAWSLVFHGRRDDELDRRPGITSISRQEEVRKAARELLRSKRGSLETEQLKARLEELKGMPMSERRSYRSSQSTPRSPLPPVLAMQKRGGTPTPIDSPEFKRAKAIDKLSPAASPGQRLEMYAAALFEPPGWHFAGTEVALQRRGSTF